MSDKDSNTVLTPEEIEAAMAEIESLAPGEGGIPNLDDGSKDGVIPVPVPVPVRVPVPGGRPVRQADTEAPATQTSAPNAAPTEADPTPGADQPPDAAVEEQAAPAPGLLGRLLSRLPLRRTAGPADSDRAPAADRISLIYRILDAILELINRPFARLSPETRHIVGIVGIATLVVSLLAGSLLPRLLPPRDAVSFLQDKRTELLVAPPEPAAEAVEGEKTSP